MKIQKIAASCALILFSGAGIFFLLNVKEREHGIAVNKIKREEDCIRQCAPRTGLFIEIKRLQNAPSTERRNYPIRYRCECR